MQPQTSSGPLLVEKGAWLNEEKREGMVCSQAGEMYIHEDENGAPLVAGTFLPVGRAREQLEDEGPPA